MCVMLLHSCRSYLDVEGRDIVTDYMTFSYQKSRNELDYFNKVNASAEKEVFYTTHFTISLPKNIVYWKQLGNKFYYEYDSKQVISIYTSYRNYGKESSNWELKDIDKGSEAKYLAEYWTARNYNKDFLDVKKSNRVTKLYTNGKYEILLYNIKEKNFTRFLDLVKTFKVKL
jgi:hypothetical protein